MHQIYQVEGIVLKSVDFGESNKYLFIITKEFGLIKIVAQSLRNLKSKLRYGLQDLSVAQINIVRGRSVWRLTNAVCEKNFYFLLSKDRNKLVVMNRVLNLLFQLLTGEEKNIDLYETVKESFSFLEKNDFEEENIKSFENIIVVRILYCLGYFDKQKVSKNGTLYASFLNLTEWNKDLLEKMGDDGIKRQVIFDINTSLKSSQLC